MARRRFESGKLGRHCCSPLFASNLPVLTCVTLAVVLTWTNCPSTTQSYPPAVALAVQSVWMPYRDKH